jgi:AmmeMemoRadiSam system protein B
MIRQPAVAGRFYPGTAAELAGEIREFTDPEARKSAVIGAVIPHAGYMYSGHVAGAVYSRIKISDRLIVLCPNHTGFGPPLSIMKSGSWVTPLGTIEIDEEISAALIAADPGLRDDIAAHRYEHAIEVQLPFLQLFAGATCRFVPITVGTGDWDDLENLGNAIAHVIRTVAPGTEIIASSDMNHYESDDITRVKDRKAIDKILQLDARGLYEVIHRERISMCGFGPTTSMLVAARQLGASRAELVKYATSGDVSGDFGHVVGYAGIAVI